MPFFKFLSDSVGAIGLHLGFSIYDLLIIFASQLIVVAVKVKTKFFGKREVFNKKLAKLLR